jgi:hypothetical protein
MRRVQVMFEAVPEGAHVDAPFVRAFTHVDGVPYYGSGANAADAVRALADTICAHGAPLPTALSFAPVLRGFDETTQFTPEQEAWIEQFMAKRGRP